MFIVASLFMLAQSQVESLTAAPDISRERQILCSCAKAEPANLYLEGVVVDAELTLGDDGRSVADRQATVFNVVDAFEGGATIDLKGRTRVFHSTNLNACGVTFDYGKRYRVPVRRSEIGALETDYCLVDGKSQ